MPVGTRSDFTIYQEEFHSGIFEVDQQELNAFNAASGGAIQLVGRQHQGDFEKNTFFKEITDAIVSRDGTSVAGVSSKKLQMAEAVKVKLDRRFGPIENTIDSFRKVMKNPREFSFVLGQQFAVARQADYLNTGLIALETAIEANTGMTFDATGESTKTMTHTHLVDGIKLFGDQASRIRVFVMHSKPFYDLLKHSITEKIYQTTHVAIFEAKVGAMTRLVIVTDSPALTDDNGSGTDTYNTLGLVPGALEVNESEGEPDIDLQRTVGKENMTMIMQGEYAFSLGVSGFKYAGGRNPSDSDLGTTGNWSQVVTSDKATAGIRIVTH